jgi:hypothetical protein
MQWEYRMELVGGAARSWRSESQEILAPLGRDGWEAVGMAPWGPGTSELMVLFKRPVGEPAGAGDGRAAEAAGS